MYDGYRAIASAYDRFNADVDYERWSDFIEACFGKFLPAKPEIVLDLACGTGRMTFPLADRGYDMIGIDGSAEMLSEASDKNNDRTDRLFEVQPRVSTAVRRRMTALRWLILVTPMDSTTVTTVARPSGMAATARETATIKVSRMTVSV